MLHSSELFFEKIKNNIKELNQIYYQFWIIKQTVWKIFMEIVAHYTKKKMYDQKKNQKLGQNMP